MKPPFDEGDCLANCSLDELEELFPSQPRRKAPIVKGIPARCSDELVDPCIMVVSFFWATASWRMNCNYGAHPLDLAFWGSYVWGRVIEPSPCSDQPMLPQSSLCRSLTHRDTYTCT